MATFKPDRRLTLQVHTPNPDPIGEPNGPPWTTIEEVWAEKMDMRESRRGQYMAAERLTDIAYTTFKTRFKAALIKAEQMICDGVTFKVIGVPAEIGRRKFLEFIGLKSQ